MGFKQWYEANDMEPWNKMAGLISAFRNAGGDDSGIETLQRVFRQRLKGPKDMRGYGSPEQAFYGTLSWLRKKYPQAHKKVISHFDPWYRNVLDMPPRSIPYKS